MLQPKPATCVVFQAMPNEPKITEMLVDLATEDFNSVGYIESAAYLRSVQAVVIKHWKRYAPAHAQASTLWIAVRHAVVHFAPGRTDDVITARTWIKRLRGVRAIFVTTISCGGRELAEVESTWVCLDSATKLPKALEPDVTRLFL